MPSELPKTEAELAEWRAAIRRQYSEWQAEVDARLLAEQRAAIRYQVRTDLYYLLRYILQRADVEHPWMLERIREVQSQPDGYLDLWGRDHRKSTVITFGRTLMDVLASHGDDPLPSWQGIEPTFGIFSHTRPIAKSFLRQLKREMETNEALKALFPDILWSNPERDAPTWSEDSGLVVKRRTNPKESTVEAWGVVDGMPTGKHFSVIVDDDIVTLDGVGSPEMIRKTTDAWSVHLNLGTTDTRLRVVGTRYHFADSYGEMITRGAVKARIRPATADGTLTGKPVFLTQDQFDKKARDMGPYVASAQLLLNPVADSRQVFKREWIRTFDAKSKEGLNVAILVDPANGKKKSNDFTAIAVIGKGADENFYLLDAIRDRLDLEERTERVMTLHQKYKPLRVGYERYGMQADIGHLKHVQAERNYRFEVIEVGGALAKVDRINRLMPVMSEGSFYVPTTMIRTLYDGKTVDLTQVLIEEELMAWPVPLHDDLMDAISRVFDIDLPWPKLREHKSGRDRYSDTRTQRRGTWMSGP
jgi:predicted phage terminase large subunit-like protein